MLTTRPLIASDYATISGFPKTAEELFYIAPFADYPWSAESFADAILGRLSNTVFLNDGHIIGFANFYDFEIGAQAFIGNVIINPAFRRRGYGTQVLKEMLNKGFNEHGFREIHLSCFSGNTAGMLLYRTLGFTPYGIEQRTDYKNEAVALVNFKLNREAFWQTSGLKLDEITTELADV